MSDVSAEAVHLLRTAPPMVVLRPGDKVLIALSDDPHIDVTQEIAVSLRASFPGVEFVVLTGVSSVAISPGR